MQGLQWHCGAQVIMHGGVFAAIETFKQLLVYDTNIDFGIIFNVGTTNSNLIFGDLNEEYNDTRYENLLFNNINHDYNYLSIRK